MRIIGFLFMLFAWINPLMSGVDVNIGPPPDSGYYYYDDDDEYYWNGPGYYNGIWFDNEDHWHNHHRHWHNHHSHGRGHHGGHRGGHHH